MATFTEGLILLERIGLIDVLLPFILIFTIMFAVLQKTKILGNERKNFNAVVSLVIALMVVIPHVTGSYPPGADVVEILNKALPSVSVIVIAIIMLLVMIGIMGGEAKWLGGPMSGWIAIVSFLIIVYVFGRSAGWFVYLPGWLRWIDDPDTQAMVIVILIFAIVIWYVTRETPEGTEKLRGLTKFSQGVGELFKKD